MQKTISDLGHHGNSQSYIKYNMQDAAQVNGREIKTDFLSTLPSSRTAKEGRVGKKESKERTNYIDRFIEVCPIFFHF